MPLLTASSSAASSSSTSATCAATWPLLPTGTSRLQHQVAGHQCQTGKDAISILKQSQHPDTILKAAHKPQCGQREIHFYRRIAEPQSNFWRQLRHITPRFYETVRLEVAGRLVEFMRLEDVTAGMLEPCVMDVKIGERTWDPLATRQKIAAESAKYAECKRQLGFSIPGYQVYKLVGEPGSAANPQRYDKEFGKSLEPSNVRELLASFLNGDARRPDATIAVPLIVDILDGLQTIYKWASGQNTLRLYSSSVLIAYDASALHDMSGTRQLRAKVRMIDFAHAFERAESDSRLEERDWNYVEGVASLLRTFESLLPGAYAVRRPEMEAVARRPRAVQTIGGGGGGGDEQLAVDGQNKCVC